MIRVQGLQKRYGEVRAVDGVSFEVERGEVVGLLGPNGAGKSTTMKMLTGFLHPDAGTVEVAGRRVDPERPATKAALGYLPETTPLYRELRVADYLDWVGRMRGLDRRARRSALGRVLADCDLGGYERRPIAQLSKGYRQRVGLAQALVAQPSVLVLDEPTSGLDPAEIGRIRALVARLATECTVVLSTHVLAEVQETCGRVVILAGGRVVADGSTLGLAEEERVELRVVLRAVDVPEPELVSAFTRLEAVEDARALGRDREGRVSFALGVEDRWRAAEAVHALAGERRWVLLGLEHQLPSLERVFLSRTRAALDPSDASASGREEEAP